MLINKMMIRRFKAEIIVQQMWIRLHQLPKRQRNQNNLRDPRPRQDHEVDHEALDDMRKTTAIDTGTDTAIPEINTDLNILPRKNPRQKINILDEVVPGQHPATGVDPAQKNVENVAIGIEGRKNVKGHNWPKCTIPPFLITCLTFHSVSMHYDSS